MPTKITVNLDHLLELYRSGVKVQTIAEILGCSGAYVSTCAKEAGLSRDPRPSPPPLEPEPEVAVPFDNLTAALKASKGRYAVLSQLAAHHGLTMNQTMQRYHAAVRG